MPISEEFIQELKIRTDIVDIISSYVNLKKVGRNMVGLCPFHNEKTPSFNVSEENGFFHCFGCGAGGDVITFIKRAENLDYIDAVKFLAQRAGMSMPEDYGDRGITNLKNRIYEANREAARFYHKQLYTPNGERALEYLRKRNLSEKTIIHFGLGYSPQSRYELVNYLRNKGFTAQELIQANLAKQSQRGYAFDRFSDRVMFPIMDLRGNVIAFGGRVMSDIKPKYLNTSDTPVFNKSRNLFALGFAKKKSFGTLILVEGYMDVIALHQAGIENAVATLGTALTQEQAMLMKKYCETVAVCYDSDDAGRKATERAIPILRDAGLKIKILNVPDGKDPDEYIRTHGEQGPARFRMLLDKSGNDVDFRLGDLRKKYDTDITEQRVEYLTEASRVIAELDSSIEQDAYLSQLSEELGAEKSAIKNQMLRFMQKNTRKDRIKRQREIQDSMLARYDKVNSEKFYNLRAANAEETLIALVMLHPDVADKIFLNVRPNQFVTSFNRKVYEILKKHSENGGNFTLTDISGEFSNDEISQIAKILAAHPRENDPERTAKDCLLVLEEENDKMTPEEIAQADTTTLMKKLQKLKEKKK